VTVSPEYVQIDAFAEVTVTVSPAAVVLAVARNVGVLNVLFVIVAKVIV
jgi:hypothetical protein